MGKASDDAILRIDGKDYIATPLSARDIGMISDEALKYYVDNRTRFLTEKAQDLIKSGLFTKEEIREEILELSNQTSDGLPKKKIEVPLKKNGNVIHRKNEDGVKVPVMVTREVEYSGWWMSNIPEAKVLVIWLSLRQEQPNVTKEMVDAWFSKELYDESKSRQKAMEESGLETTDFDTPVFTYDEDALTNAADVVGRISQPSVGTSKND